MSSMLNPLLNAITGRKSLRDYQHASRTFRDGNYRLAPKHKFLFHVVFDLSPDAAKALKDETKREISMLVKSVDLPTYSFETQTMNQYNRHRHVQTKLNFNPINIRLHDDMTDITRNMWYAYMDYYYTDQAYENHATYRWSDTYSPRVARMFGYERAQRTPFFEAIKVYSIYDKKFTEYTLINPMLTNFSHDSHDHSQSDILENQMQVQYELVKYATGMIGGVNSPTGFGDLHYDKEPSPLSPKGGGTQSMFGVGGLLDSAGAIGSDLASGSYGSAAIQGLRTLQNFQNVNPKEFLMAEATQAIKKQLKGEDPFAFPGADKQKINVLPKSNMIEGTAVFAETEAQSNSVGSTVAKVDEGNNSAKQTGSSMAVIDKAKAIGGAFIVGAVVNKITDNKVAGAAAAGIMLSQTLGGRINERKGVNENNPASDASNIKTNLSDAEPYSGGAVHPEKTIVRTTSGEEKVISSGVENAMEKHKRLLEAAAAGEGNNSYRGYKEVNGVLVETNIDGEITSHGDQ